ncbi:Uncharacterised protein [Candidatus Gugararchaeum adminiculabundum]|nr:Uncharacterised protein [Candidatus Gugararchaeum adminiculabundum]
MLKVLRPVFQQPQKQPPRSVAILIDDLLRYMQANQNSKYGTPRFVRQIRPGKLSEHLRVAEIAFNFFLNRYPRNAFECYVQLQFRVCEANLLRQPVLDVERKFWACTRCNNGEKDENDYSVTVISYPCKAHPFFVEERSAEGISRIEAFDRAAFHHCSKRAGQFRYDLFEESELEKIKDGFFPVTLFDRDGEKYRIEKIEDGRLRVLLLDPSNPQQPTVDVFSTLDMRLILEYFIDDYVFRLLKKWVPICDELQKFRAFGWNESPSGFHGKLLAQAPRPNGANPEFQ